MAVKKTMSVGEWITIGVILAIVVGIAGFMAIRQTRMRAEQTAAFGANMDAYLIEPKPAAAGAAPKSTGKVVVIDADKREVDNVHFNLPKDLQATKPEEVGTIVQTRYTSKQFGTFEGGGRALQLTCTLKLMDKASGTLIGTATFTGPEPPKSIPRSTLGEDVDGGAPIPEIIEFVRKFR